MILPDNVSPQYSLYYIGAKILQTLQKSGGKAQIADIYVEMKQTIGLSYRLMVFALDWLYLIGTVEKKGNTITITLKQQQ